LKEELLLNGCLKESLVDGFVDAFFIQYILPGILMTNEIILFKLPNRQQLIERSEILILVDALIALAGSDDYLRISARSCKESMGAGGTTAKPRKPPKIKYLRGLSNFC
jgi:hypothetical protein